LKGVVGLYEAAGRRALWQASKPNLKDRLQAASYRFSLEVLILHFILNFILEPTLLHSLKGVMVLYEAAGRRSLWQVSKPNLKDRLQAASYRFN